MTAAEPPRSPPFGLRIDLGHHTRPWSPEHGHWNRPPTADFTCRCGWSDSATGDAVKAFVNTVARTHQATCPLNPQNRKAA